MNKSDKIRSLTWKYFWQQKKDEIGYCIFCIFCVILFISIFTRLFGIADMIEKGTWGFEYPIWLKISSLVIWGIWLIGGFINWINSNCEKASARAKREVKE